MARALDASGTPVDSVEVEWSTLNESVADVSASGVVRVRGNGATEIVASVGSVRASVPVTVQQVADTLDIVASDVELIAIGQRQALRVRAYDRTNYLVRGRVYEWSTFDPDVATVDSTGTLTAIANGSTLVRGAIDGVADTVEVTVRQEPRSVVVSPPFRVLSAGGEAVTLGAEVADSLGVVIAGLGVEWTSTDDAVATVSSDGRVTATGTGVAGIVATHDTVWRRAAITVGDVEDWSAVGDWRTHQGDADHSGYVPVFLDVDRFQPSWTVTPTVGLHLNPVVVEGDDVAFVTNSLNQSKIVGVLSSQSGAEKWRVELAASHHADPPAIDGGRVFAVTRSTSTSRLLAYDAATGAEQFVSFFDGSAMEFLSPVPHEGRIYVPGGATGGLYRFDATTGAQDWHAPLPAYDLWTPVVDQGSAYAYVGADAPGVYTIDAETGAITDTGADPGHQAFEPRLRTSPVRTQGNRLVVTQEGRLVVYDLADLSQVWSLVYDGQNRFEYQPAVADGSIFTINRGRLDVRDEVDGALLWSWNPPDLDSLSGPVVVTRNLVFVTSSSALYAIHRGSRELAWSSSKTGSIAFSSDGGLFIVDEDAITRVDLR
ncbi:MAG: PQQ-binding-like beta-propeller repeat protein [Longimicrobiales bacterium]|nr:PQQ-binding-like beta-propeller repeat protein [Longimicrobiales bacterium]